MSYHGSILKNADGSNKIISGNGRCIVPIKECMWKYPTDVANGVKTRSKAKKMSQTVVMEN